MATAPSPMMPPTTTSMRDAGIYYLCDEFNTNVAKDVVRGAREGRRKSGLVS